MAPKVNLVLRRTKFADSDLWKQAVKQPKPITRKYVLELIYLRRKIFRGIILVIREERFMLTHRISKLYR